MQCVHARFGPRRFAIFLLAATLTAPVHTQSGDPAGPASSFRTDSSAFLVRRQAYVMGTRATLAIAGGTHRDTALASLEQMLRVLETAERELSTWRSDSVLSRLNTHPVGAPLSMSDELCSVLLELDHWRDQTGGAFDPAVGALVSAWALRDGGRLPTPASLELARARSGLSFLHVTMDPCTVTRRADVTVDAGGFGKGLALDRLLTLRPRYGSTSGPGRWMVDLGGQVAVSPVTERSELNSHGSTQSAGWPVAVAHPVHRDQSVLELRLDSGSLAVSGGSERDRQVEGTRVGHILDPRRGVPANRPFSVAVWHPRALVADVLSTALYVMGVEEGLAWAEAHAVAVCYLIPATDSLTGSATGSPIASQIKATEVTLEASSIFRTRFGTAF